MAGLNVSQNTSEEIDLSVLTEAFIITGWLHLLLVVLPVLVLGPIVLSIFLTNKKLRDPVSIVFTCVTLVCILGPLSNGLLMDISWITGVEVFGSCQTRWPRVFWLLNTTGRWLLLAGSSLLSVVQYVTVRWGGKKMNACSTIIAFLVITAISLLSAFLTFLGPERLTTIRGSLCAHPGSATAGLLTSLVSILVFTVPLVIIVVVCSSLTIRHVKTNTIANSQIVRNVTWIAISWTIIVIISRLLPVLTLFNNASVSTARIDPTSSIISYLVEVMYPLVLIFLLFAHKTARATLLRKLGCIAKVKEVKLKRPNNKVAPVTTTDTSGN